MTIINVDTSFIEFWHELNIIDRFITFIEKYIPEEIKRKETEINEIIGPVSDQDRIDARIVNAYVKINRFDEVVKSWQIATEREPKNARFHLSLGAAYLQIGQRQKAIEEIQKSIDLDENLKEQGEFYIKEIKAGRNP